MNNDKKNEQQNFVVEKTQEKKEVNEVEVKKNLIDKAQDKITENINGSENLENKKLGEYTKRNFSPSQSDVGGVVSQFKKKNFRVRGKRICNFCAQGILKIDYKDKETLEKYLTPYAKILSRRQNGNCAMHQRHLANAIKRARVIALLPFVRE